MDDQVQEAAHSDELRKKVKVSRKRTNAPDGRGQRIDDVTSPEGDAEGADVPKADSTGSPGVRKSSS
jgi:hypothetical protein